MTIANTMLLSTEQHGFIGNTFLVAIETAEVTLTWDNMCIPERIINFIVSSATDGLSAFKENNMNDIIIRNNEISYDGVIILTFIEKLNCGIPALPNCIGQVIFYQLTNWRQNILWYIRML